MALALMAVVLAIASSPANVSALLPADARGTAGETSLFLRILFLIDAILCSLAAFARWRPATGIDPSITGIRLADGRTDAPRWILPSIVVGGLFLRLPGIDSQIWLDEIATLTTYLRHPWYQTLTLYESANQHMLYSVLGSLSIHAFGESAWAARLPALLFGVASIWAIDLMGRAVTSRKESLLAAALLAVSYHGIWFSQSARGYSGMIFFACVGTALFFAAVTTNRVRTWLAYAIVMALGVGTLQNTAFVAAAHLVAWIALIVVRRVPARVHAAVTRRVVGSVALAAYLSIHIHALILPRIAGFLGNAAARQGIVWTGFAKFVPVVTAGLKQGLGILGILAVAAFMAMAVWSLARQSPLFTAVAILAAPLNLAVIIAIGYRPYPRSFLYVLPFALLFAARGAAIVDRFLVAKVAVLKRLASLPIAGTALVVVSLVPLPRLYRLPKQDYLGALHRARADSRAGDCIAAIGLAANAYDHYYAPDLNFPRNTDELRALERRCPRVWLLYTFPGDMKERTPDIVESIHGRYDPVASFPGTVGDGTVYVARSKSGVTR